MATVCYIVKSFLILVKPYIILFGGNTGTVPVNDVWIINVDKAPYVWEKIVCAGPNPSPRVYQDASLCTFGTACGMIVVYGTLRITPKEDEVSIRPRLMIPGAFENTESANGTGCRLHTDKTL